MVSMLYSGSSSLGSSPGWGDHCYIVFLGKILNSHTARVGVKMGTSKCDAGGNLTIDWHPTRGEELLAAKCYKTKISSGLMGQKAQRQTFPYPDVESSYPFLSYLSAYNFPYLQQKVEQYRLKYA